MRELWKSLGPRGQLTIVGAGLATVALLFILFQIASRPSYTALATGLDPAEASEMAAALDASGIQYQIVNGGTQIDVVKGQEADARVALAAEGLPTGGHVGYEIFDEQKLGTTDFQQQVNYQRALEGEIARTIEAIDGVTSAQVSLVLPEEQLFVDDSDSQASAAVLVTSSSTLDAAAVKGIANLVGSSVKGLETKNITITDGSGTILWPTADSGFSVATKLEAEQMYGAQLAAQANALLAQTLGPNKAQARVHAVLNVDQTTENSVTYASKGTPLTKQTETESLQGTGTSSATAAGTASNIPGYAATQAGGGDTSYKSKKETTDFGVNKTVTSRVIAPGTVERLDVAVLFDKSVPADQVIDLRNAVGALVGLDPKRGDTISTATLEFAPPPEAEKPTAGVAALLANPIGLVKWVALGLATIVFLFLMRRGLRRREGEKIAPEPTWLRQIEGAVPIAQLTAGEGSHDPVRERRELTKSEVEEIVKREPERVAAQVGQWLKE